MYSTTTSNCNLNNQQSINEFYYFVNDLNTTHSELIHIPNNCNISQTFFKTK